MSSADVCASCGKPKQPVRAVLGFASLPLDCRDCCAEVLGYAKGLRALGFFALIPVLILVAVGMRDPLVIGLFMITLLLIARMGHRQVRVSSRWPDLRPAAHVYPEFETRDGPPPHEPFPPPGGKTPRKDD